MFINLTFLVKFICYQNTDPKETGKLILFNFQDRKIKIISKYHLFQKSAGKKIPCMHCLKHKMQSLIQLLKLMQNIQSTNIYIKTEQHRYQHLIKNIKENGTKISFLMLVQQVSIYSNKLQQDIKKVIHSEQLQLISEIK